jgi:ABC-2 type transport system ATP-binding protein
LSHKLKGRDEEVAMAVIEVDGLRKRYRGTTAVDGISFSVERGEIFGIVGPNGAGKTTTVEIMEGLRRPDEGTVRVLGLDPQRDGRRLHQRIGVQLQDAALADDLKVWEALDLYASFYRQPADWRRLLEDWGLGEKRNTAFKKLSGGQRQRLFVALALVGNPEVAFLDELTTGLDPQARRAAWDLIRRIRDQGVTVILVSHFMEEAEALCDRIAIIDRGRVVAMDTPDRLVARVSGGQTIRFRPRGRLEPGVLESLPGVSRVTTADGQVVVTCDDQVLATFTSTLARHNVIAADLRVETATLEDAFLHLTGRQQDPADPGPR